jgi:hypothetical protein
MPYLNCPRCALSIRVRADFLTIRNCPRCIARARLPVPMYSSASPPRISLLRSRQEQGDSRAAS